MIERAAGWLGPQWDGELDGNKRQALDHVELADERSLTTHKHTAKASVLLSELCIGISGGRGSRSMWTSKTNRPGQVESVRSSAAVLATIRILDSFNFDPQVIAVAEEMFLHRLDCLD